MEEAQPPYCRGLLLLLLQPLLVGIGLWGWWILLESSKGASQLFRRLSVDRSVVLTKQPVFPSLTSSLSAICCRSVG